MDTPSWIPEPSSGIEIRTVMANGQQFEVAIAGKGPHIALCLHGFPEFNYSWRAQIPLLVRLGYRVWAPNLRGYGQSSRPRGVAAYALPELLADVAGLIDAAQATDTVLIGHDWGGALAWAFAIRRQRPLARLVVMNAPHPAIFARELKTWSQRRRSWYIYFFQLPWLPEVLLAANGARRIRGAFRSKVRDSSRLSRQDLQVYATHALQPGALTAMINWYRAAFRQLIAGGHGKGKTLPRIEVPTLLIWGEQDLALGIGNTHGLDAYIDQLTLKRLPGVSHWVQQDAPEQVNALLETWLETHPA